MTEGIDRRPMQPNASSSLAADEATDLDGYGHIVTDDVTGPLKSSMFDVLQVDATVTGLAGPQPVKLIEVDRLTNDSANVAYRTETGIVERIVFADSPIHARAVSSGLASRSTPNRTLSYSRPKPGG